MRVGIVTLGCDKNTVDNEYLAGLLAARGCEVVPTDDLERIGELDAAVVTTCGFIEDAKRQSIESIFELAEGKRSNNNPQRLYVAGCLAQRYADELLAEVPEIDALLGVGQFHQLADLILERASLPGQNSTKAVPKVDIYTFMQRKKLDSKPHAFLKVADGCNHACTFCSIPIMKGKLSSVPHEILLEEARGLIAQGVRELNLVAQDLADYGRDRGKDYRLPQLLKDLCALEGDFWIRCFYLYPGGINDEMIATIANEPKIVPYIDMPLQHLDFGVLRRMKRPYREVNTFTLIEKLRREIPGLVLRSTMIVGFPGETDEEHEAMLEGVRSLRIERLGAFRYSQEEDTPAGQMEQQIDEATRDARWHAVMEMQAEIAAEANQLRIGERTRVLIEDYDRDAGAFSGRSPKEAPEVDGVVFVESEEFLRTGEFVDVEITHVDTYDCFAQVV